MADVEDWYRNAGIVMPFISNDGYSYGNFAPGTGLGAVDIYGFDSYPLGFDCGQPSVWAGLSGQYFPGLIPPANQPAGSLAQNPRWNVLHQLQSPTTPMHVSEVRVDNESSCPVTFSLLILWSSSKEGLSILGVAVVSTTVHP